MTINTKDLEASKEIARIIKKGEIAIEEEKGIAQQLASLAKGKAYFFKDEREDEYARVGDRNLRLKSKDFQKWLMSLAYQQMGDKMPSTETLKKVTLLLQGQTLYESPQHDLHVRTSWSDDGLWYDLGRGKAVKISRDGWEVSSKVPILFRTFTHQKSQVEPLQGGSVDEVFEFLNFPSSGGMTPTRLLFLVWLVEAFIPGFPHFVAAVHGREGSGKSTIGKLSKSLVDPSILEEHSLPHGTDELVQQLAHHWLVHLDNLSRLPRDVSDNLCKAVTGAGFSKRELYTSDEDVVYSFKRVLILNGINQIVENSDLLDRSLLLSVSRIKRNKGEREFWQRFEERKPFILGAIFNLVVEAMRKIDDIKVEQFRMADASRWGLAITRTLGMKDENFLDALEMNVQKRHEEALDANLVAQILRDYMSHRVSDSWEASPTTMHTTLKSHAEQVMEIDTRTYPKQSNWLWKSLERAQTNLEAFGIHLSRSRTDKERVIRVTTSKNKEVVEEADNAVSAVMDDVNDSNDANEIQEKVF